ncbi:MAG: hypothetical protein F6K40_06095 [Okeania sp. SIO3I5]|uniref:hypothetical protein n=1 Tax=Okeania sp. SIO3I5 TaxID=2607805 RepID=UPI0013B88D71|nr:hypothetical protein [Okeania sp. SIO3I5]NEQ35879.1 hypothetical protein [Okeania sp. SIO3I5]
MDLPNFNTEDLRDSLVATLPSNERIEGTMFTELASQLYIKEAFDLTEAELKLELEHRARYSLIAAEIFAQVRTEEQNKAKEAS